MFSQLPSADQFLPHGSCLLWYPELLVLHAVSDALIALSYYSIPAALGYFLWRRRDILFPWVFVLFAVFILACGTTHLLGIWTLWNPNYLLDGSVKLFTAIASVGTAIILWRLMPDLLAIPSTAQLAGANRELAREVAGHREAEARAERLAAELERRVVERTRELEQRTAELSAEVENRRRAEESLTETSERFRYLFMNNPLPMYVYDRNTLAYLEVNQTAIALYGYPRDEFLSMTLIDIRPPEDVDRLLTALEGTRGGSREAPGWRHRRKDGTMLHVDLFVHDILFEGRSACLVTAIDVTAHRAIEDQLHQAQKMEVIGQLTGGVAHDFNNLLTVVLGNAQLLESMTDDCPEQRELCLEIAASARHGADLTQRLLAFARRQTLSPDSIDVTRLVFEMRALLARAVGETIRIDVLCDAEIWPAYADSAQLESALLNLVVNARDAMPKGGRVVIELRNETRTHQVGPGVSGPAAGDYVALAVVDNGAGMTGEVLSRAFEPFFTTKPTGRGSGLGLSMVYGFAQQSGGDITITSEPGRGTAATLLLPRAPTAVVSAPAPERPAAQPATGHETVLVVEDEAPVRRFVRRQLERLGYRVLQASDGPSALRLLESEAAVDLLFVDIIMPGGLNGLQVASAARILRPTLRVLLTSGYSDTVLEPHGADEPFGKLLQKPYQLSDLAGAIRGRLDQVA